MATNTLSTVSGSSKANKCRPATGGAVAEEVAANADSSISSGLSHQSVAEPSKLAQVHRCCKSSDTYSIA